MKNVKKSVTFAAIILCLVFFAMAANAANSTTVVCDHKWTAASSEGTPCSGYLNIYVCSKCYATKEEKLEATQSHKWAESYSEAATCTKDGCVMYYCETCLELKTVEKKALGHSYTYASNNDATCTKDGTSIRKCQICSETDMVTDKGSALGHDFSGEWKTVISANCQREGRSTRKCSRCSAVESRLDPITAHGDKNGDYKCDVCSADLSPEAAEKPDASDEIIKDCSCKCHKGGIAGFFWKIGNFFNKLFKIKSKQICDCGVYHF